MSVLTTEKNPHLQDELFEFTHGIEVDKFLYDQEIRVQKEWVRALYKIKKLNEDEVKKLEAVLDEAHQLFSQGVFPWLKADEDIHMNLERFVTESLGDLGKRMHWGRSRNDLIATTLRLFVHDTLKNIVAPQLAELLHVLCDKAQETSKDLVPGTTHLQHAQPLRLGHIFASYGWAFLRDQEKIQWAQKQAIAFMPLGSAALAGTTLPINLKELSQCLGFTSPPMNSYDAVGDRDFLIYALEALAGLSLHLSRWAEDTIYWSSTAVGLLKLPRRWSTGSSIMPNKRNPDVPELVRAKSAHVMSTPAHGYLLMKALPTSYDSDLHEIKIIYIKALQDIQSCLSIMPKFIQELSLQTQQAQKLLKEGHLLATEVANHLTHQGLSFRESYRQTAALVELAEKSNLSLEQLPWHQTQTLSPKIDPHWWANLSFENSVESRNQTGGTSLAQTLQGIQSLRLQICQIHNSKKP